MSVVVDSSAVVAMYLATDRHHASAMAWGKANEDEMLFTPLVLAEIDFVLLRRGGPPTQRAFWDDLHDEVFTVRWWASGMRETIAIAREHPHLGLADASLLALGRMLNTDRLATFDAHFESFDLTLLPERT